eukprot:TRINITY_DN6276_c0_g1_i7.p1 TRINITY_DN6276_c0_g1~~TRINITY_DN6276_c0_g1_i7.p1  ORF type:complete len:398 (+),score=13.92 TRINITY_DN6276_c0_g1_i7:182-1375(+)
MTLDQIQIYWIILGHEYILCLFLASNLQDLEDLTSGPIISYIFGAEYAVDVFFFMSGFFFVYVFQKRFGAGGPRFIDYPLIVLHRILRIIPTYVVVALFLWKVIPFLGSGPFWQAFVESTNRSCTNSAWSDFLFINNLLISNVLANDCIGWGWYLACDSQIFILMPIFMALLLKSRLLGKATITGLLVASLVYSFFLSETYGFQALGATGMSEDYFTKYYLVPWTRAPPYLFGVLVGLWYIEERGRLSEKLARSRILQLVSAAVGILTMYWMIKITEPLFKDPNAYTRLQNSLIVSLSRTVFVAGLTALLLPGLVGSKLLQDLLGNNFFHVLSKLTFSTYLIHLVVILFIYSSVFLTHYEMFSRSLGSTVISFAIALLLSVFVELPFANLERILLKR